MSDKKNKTFSIRENVHTDFKIECTYNGADMSETVESFMASYVRISRETRIKSNLNE